MAIVYQKNMPAILAFNDMIDSVLSELGGKQTVPSVRVPVNKYTVESICGATWEFETVVGKMTARAIGSLTSHGKVVCEFEDFARSEKLIPRPNSSEPWLHTFPKTLSLQAVCVALRERIESLLPRET